MRILMVGGTGFIGGHVMEQLAREHEVAVLHRGKHTPPVNSVWQIIGDRNNLAGSSAEFRRFSPEVVLDMISGDEGQARTVVETFRGLARRLVTISSMDVYRPYEVMLGQAAGPVDNTPLTEDSPLRTLRYPARNIALGAIFDWVTPYYEKIHVEEVVRRAPALPATILRLPMVYGPGDPLHRFFPLLKRMDDGRPALLIEEGSAAWRGPMGYVGDVAHAIALAVTNEASAGRTYNVAEAEALSWAEWAGAIAQAAGWHGRIVTLPREQTPTHLLSPFNPAQHWIVDSTRIRRELGYRECVPRAEALARTVASEREHPAPFDPKAFDYEAEDRALAAETA